MAVWGAMKTEDGGWRIEDSKDVGVRPGRRAAGQSQPTRHADMLRLVGGPTHPRSEAERVRWRRHAKGVCTRPRTPCGERSGMIRVRAWIWGLLRLIGGPTQPRSGAINKGDQRFSPGNGGLGRLFLRGVPGDGSAGQEGRAWSSRIWAGIGKPHLRSVPLGTASWGFFYFFQRGGSGSIWKSSRSNDAILRRFRRSQTAATAKVTICASLEYTDGLPIPLRLPARHLRRVGRGGFGGRV
jgi:hypothetical protein